MDALELPWVRPFDIMGKPMEGWVMIEREGFKNDKDLNDWLNRDKEFEKGSAIEVNPDMSRGWRGS